MYTNMVSRFELEENLDDISGSDKLLRLHTQKSRTPPFWGPQFEKLFYGFKTLKIIQCNRNIKIPNQNISP
jgi:hypothetical protein